MNGESNSQCIMTISQLTPKENYVINIEIYMFECCFNHRYYIQVCVYSVYVLYVTLKEMNKVKLQILTADTHTIFIINVTNNIMMVVAD